MTPSEQIQKLADTVNFGIRHKNYEQAKTTADNARKLMTRNTEDQYEEITKYRIRETEEQKKQRTRLTNTITAAAISPTYGYFEEVKRSDGIRLNIEASENDIAKVEEKYKEYFKGVSFKDYAFDTVLHLNKYDPNAWIIFSQEIKQGEQGNKVEFYPIQVTSEEAIDFNYNHRGVLQYFTARFVEKKRKVVAGALIEVDQTIYINLVPGLEIVAYQECEADEKSREEYLTEGYEAVNWDNAVFFVKAFENTTTEVPVTPIGAYLDPNQETFELPIAEAEPILHDLIRDKSYLDTNKTLHTFPRRKEYVKKCTYSDEDGACYEGFIDGDREKECKSCKGTGKIVSTSEQDITYLRWPDQADEFVELSKLSFTEPLDISLVQFLDEQVEKLQKAVFRAVFNQELVDKTATVQTATEIRIEYDKIYNKLSPFMSAYARVVEKGYRIAFQYLGLSYGSVSLSYPHDFKMKSETELIEEYNSSISLPFPIRESISYDLLAKKYRNSPSTMQMIQTVEAWKPWRDKSAEEIAMIIGMRSETDYQRVLWENWGEISMEIMKSEVAFQNMSLGGQKLMLEGLVDKYREQVQYKTAPNLFDDEIIGEEE